MGGAYLGRRLLQAFVTILMIVVLNFILFRLMPGSPERAALRIPGVEPARCFEQTRIRLGLGQAGSSRDQLVAYIASTAQGDLGYSYKYRGQPVAEVIGARVWPTLILFGLGEAIAIVVGLSLGRLRRLETRRPVDYLGNGAVADPVLDAVLPARHDPAGRSSASTLGWFPVSGMFTLGARVRVADRQAAPTSRATSSCRWPRSPSA